MNKKLIGVTIIALLALALSIVSIIGYYYQPNKQSSSMPITTTPTPTPTPILTPIPTPTQKSPNPDFLYSLTGKIVGYEEYKVTGYINNCGYGIAHSVYINVTGFTKGIEYHDVIQLGDIPAMTTINVNVTRDMNASNFIFKDKDGNVLPFRAVTEEEMNHEYFYFTLMLDYEPVK